MPNLAMVETVDSLKVRGCTKSWKNAASGNDTKNAALTWPCAASVQLANKLDNAAGSYRQEPLDVMVQVGNCCSTASHCAPCLTCCACRGVKARCYLDALGPPTLTGQLQVNTSGEESKFGVEPADAPQLAEHIHTECKNLRFRGLMTIGQQDYSSRPENFMVRGRFLACSLLLNTVQNPHSCAIF